MAMHQEISPQSDREIMMEIRNDVRHIAKCMEDHETRIRYAESRLHTPVSSGCADHDDHDRRIRKLEAQHNRWIGRDGLIAAVVAALISILIAVVGAVAGAR
jgi:hypothetical protein